MVFYYVGDKIFLLDLISINMKQLINSLSVFYKTMKLFSKGSSYFLLICELGSGSIVIFEIDLDIASSANYGPPVSLNVLNPIQSVEPISNSDLFVVAKAQKVILYSYTSLLSTKEDELDNRATVEIMKITGATQYLMVDEYGGLATFTVDITNSKLVRTGKHSAGLMRVFGLPSSTKLLARTSSIGYYFYETSLTTRLSSIEVSLSPTKRVLQVPNTNYSMSIYDCRAEVINIVTLQKFETTLAIGPPTGDAVF
jgi:hypothetical protein